VAFALTRFAIGLIFGQRIGWNAQQRSRARLEWGEAARVLWPQTLFGLALGLCFAVTAPWALIFGAPIVLALAGAIPIAVISSLPRLGQWSMRVGLFAIPEDRKSSASDAPTIHVTTV